MLLLVLMLMLMIESVYPRFFPQKFRPPGKPFQHSHKHIYDSNETLFLRNQLLRDKPRTQGLIRALFRGISSDPNWKISHFLQRYSTEYWSKLDQVDLWQPPWP